MTVKKPKKSDKITKKTKSKPGKEKKVTSVKKKRRKEHEIYEASPTLPVRELIIDAIYNLDNSDDNVFILDMKDSYALLIKKCAVKINYVKNPNSMQPREMSEEKTFFHLFALQWYGDKIAGELIDMGMPVIFINYPEDVVRYVKKVGYPGESV